MTSTIWWGLGKLDEFIKYLQRFSLSLFLNIYQVDMQFIMIYVIWILEKEKKILCYGKYQPATYPRVDSRKLSKKVAINCQHRPVPWFIVDNVFKIVPRTTVEFVNYLHRPVPQLTVNYFMESVNCQPA